MGLRVLQGRSELPRLTVLVAVLVCAPALARDPAPPATQPSVPPAATPTDAVASTDETGPLYATPSRRDRAGRIVAPVQINGRGPFRFILDTGANRSAISAETAEQLGLEVEFDAPMGVHGVTGSSVLPSVMVASLRAGDIDFGGRRIPVLPPAVFGGTHGILGIDALQDARVEVDFARDRVTIRHSSGRRAPYGYLVLRAERRHGGLLMVDGKVGRVPIKAILDTGAERSLGNEALFEALSLTSRRAREGVATTVIGATSHVAKGTTFTTPTIALGPARLHNLTVTFGDLHVFDVWSLDDEPALLIGMDLLGRLQHIVIDYPRGEFQLRAPPGTQPTMRSCGSNECATRLPRPGA